MNNPIEDYGLIGNTITSALVARDGSIDWLCLPHFEGDACFAALLGGREHGRWQLKPAGEIRRATRRYLPDTAILETTFETATGTATIVDTMPFTDDERFVDVVRIVRGVSGYVELCMDLVIRFGYGRTVPWVRRHDYGISAVAGPAALQLQTPVVLTGCDYSTVARFGVGAGDEVPFRLAYHPSHKSARKPPDCRDELDRTAARWREWSGRCRYECDEHGSWRAAVERSLITLKTLTYSPTGGIVAAPTTSLPEGLGGVRNWDYRFCWIRDATLTLYSLIVSGYREEARAWRRWLLRAAAGEPRQLQVLYGLDGTRRNPEIEVDWLPGYEGSTPVRLGNAACEQTQLDVPGELMDMLHVAREYELEFSDHAWALQRAILDRLERDWVEPDEGIWEIRGGPVHFTFSKLMCWVAFDRAVRSVEDFGLPGPVERWRETRKRIRADIERNGWSERRQSFVQSYGSEALDASSLLVCSLGFVRADDPRFRKTVEAIERELMLGGLVMRYRVEDTPDGLPGEEGAFLACSFWLADAYVLLGRRAAATALFETLLGLRNDLGLLAEQYDPRIRRQLGNFPQAFSHVALVNTANNLASASGPVGQRGARCS